MSTSRRFPHHAEVIKTFDVLRAEWARVEPDHPITINFAPYHETFLDMARAVVNARHERTAPVQGPRNERGTISWAEHVEAWECYAERYPGQSAERIAERGGFGLSEIRQFLGREPRTYRVLSASGSDRGR